MVTKLSAYIGILSILLLCNAKGKVEILVAIVSISALNKTYPFELHRFPLFVDARERNVIHFPSKC